MKLLAELDKKQGIGLVERVKQGQGRPTKLYVKRFTTRTAPSKPVASPPNDFSPCSDVAKKPPQEAEKPTLIMLREISLTLTTLIHPSPQAPRRCHGDGSIRIEGGSQSEY